MTSGSGPEPEEPPIRFTDNRKIKVDSDGAGGAEGTDGTEGAPDTTEAPPAPPADETPAAGDAPDAAPSPDGDADAAATAGADAPTVPLEDLQRLSAEYTNYRRRAERERLAAGEVAAGKVVADLLPILDDLDRAKAHGDLTGALKAVADKFDGVLAKLGVSAFGEVGDAFDPSRHEAVMHDESDAVTVPTCTTVMRRGYQLGERLLRPAMVGVSDPAPGAGPAVEDAVEDATAGSERHVESDSQPT